MAYTPPIGGSVGLSFTGSYATPNGATVNIEFDAGFIDGRVRAVGAIAAPALGTHGVSLKSRRVVAQGFNASTFPIQTIDRDVPHIRPEGIASTAIVGTPQYVRWRRFLSPLGITSFESFYSVERIRLLGGYNPPPGGSVALNWFNEPYSPPPASNVNLEFGALGYGYIFATAGNVSSIGVATLTQPLAIKPAGMSLQVFGAATVQTSINELRVSGFSTLGIGSPNVANGARSLLPSGIPSAAFGTQYIWNLRQYARLTGFDSLQAGTHFLSGGVKYVTPNGLNANVFGTVLVVNTTANQSARPTGIAPPPMGAVNVSPRIVYPNGIFSAVFGTPKVHFPPRPLGFESSAYGRPTIEYKTKHLTLSGIGSFDTGYPRVFDPTRKLLVPSLLQTGIFGDTSIRNKNKLVHPSGFNSLSMPDFATVESNLRFLLHNGWSSLGIGSATILNGTPSIVPNGIDALRGLTSIDVGYAVRYVKPSGITSFQILGSPVVTKTPQLSPIGFQAGAVGTSTVWLRVRTIEAIGQDQQLISEPTVWFRSRVLQTEGFATASYGAGSIEHTRRVMLASGSSHSSYGIVKVDNSNRTVAPLGIYEDFASGHMVGGTRYLLAVGFVATSFGTRIIPERQYGYPLGFTSSYGIPVVENRRRVIKPNGFIPGQQPADCWGVPRVWNLRQYVTMFYDPDSGLNIQPWSQWTKIENRNHVLSTFGQVASRVAEPYIFNNARLINPSGIGAPSTPENYKAGMVAYRIRRLPLEGMEPPYISSWCSVYNDARLITPTGYTASRFGLAGIVKTRRYFDHIGGFDSAWFGYPMVADRVRVVSFENRYTIAPTQIPLPEAKLYTRYVDGIGKDLSGIGSPSLTIHFNRITPRWTMRDAYGYPTLHNVTPEVRTRGRNAEEFGDTSVRLQWRPLNHEGALMQLFGRTEVAFRDRVRFISGFRAGAFGDKLKVTKTGAPPYSTQYIWLDAENDQQTEGHGIPPIGEQGGAPQVPSPIINQQVVYVYQSSAHTKYGNHRITANTIRVEPGYQDLVVGSPIVSLKIRVIEAGSVLDVYQPSRPRLSPHTLWAVMDAPDQAMRNHLPQQLHYVNSSGGYREPGEVFGFTTVTLQHRKIKVPGGVNTVLPWNLTSYGQAVVELRKRYIEPQSIKSLRFGWHSIPGTQFVDQFDSTDSMETGIPKVGPPPYLGAQTIQNVTLSPFAAGNLLIEFRNRAVSAVGFNAQMFGLSANPAKPYMWQGIRVGANIPNIPNGVDMNVFGTTWISNRIRGVSANGFEAFLSEYQLEAFDKRMKVTRRDPPRVPTQITPVGISSFSSGVPDVRHGVRYIRPDGNSDQYRKGAF